MERNNVSKPAPESKVGYSSPVNAGLSERNNSGQSSEPVYGQTRRSANMHHLWNEAKVLDDEPAPADLVSSRKSSKEDDAKLARADQISIRADTLRAAKRRLFRFCL